jgi:uncharacterized protein YbjT (DUF2867 family)
VKILMAGATGLVGRFVLQHVLADSRIERVHSLARRGSGVHHPKLFEHIGPMETWPDMVSVLEGDAAISTWAQPFAKRDQRPHFWRWIMMRRLLLRVHLAALVCAIF